jgi:hypothetical protein
MQFDRYTKTVLTFIAVALTYLCVVQTVRPESVQAQPTYTVPVAYDGIGNAVVPVIEYKQSTTLLQGDNPHMVMQYVPAK